MARFGRGQPHAPIILRNPADAVPAARWANCRISIIQQQFERASNTRPRGSHTFLRNVAALIVPAALAANAKIHVINQAVKRSENIRPKTSVVIARNPSAFTMPPAKWANSRVFIVQQQWERASNTRPKGAVVRLRNSAALVVPPARWANLWVILAQQQFKRASDMRPKGSVLFTRNSGPPPVPPARPAYLWITVIQQQWERASNTRPHGAAIFLRNPQAQLFYNSPAPFTATEAARLRASVRPHGAAIILRTKPPGFGPAEARDHVFLTRRDARVRERAHIITRRNPADVVAKMVTPQYHVFLTAQYPRARHPGAFLFVHGARSSVPAPTMGAGSAVGGGTATGVILSAPPVVSIGARDPYYEDSLPRVPSTRRPYPPMIVMTDVKGQDVYVVEPFRCAAQLRPNIEAGAGVGVTVDESLVASANFDLDVRAVAGTRASVSESFRMRTIFAEPGAVARGIENPSDEQMIRMLLDYF